MQARHCISLFLYSLGFGLAQAAWAYPEYRVTVVAPAGSYGIDINNKGVVVGSYLYKATANHAFLNRGSGLVDLGTVGGTASAAVAINDKGQVLAHWTTRMGQQRGFLYYRGTVRDIGTIPGRLTTFTDINYSGYITAYGAVAGSFDGPRSFLRAPDGTYRDIGSLPYENPMTLAYALNNCNQITGASGPLTFPDQPLRAFVWIKGVMRDLGDLGSTPNGGNAINNCGQITGYGSVPQGFRDRHAFLYGNGRLLDLEAVPATEDLSSEGAGINGRGHIVGGSAALGGFVYRGLRMQSLNALVDPALGWDIRLPRAINDAGQIAATAYRGGQSYAVRLDLIVPLTTPAPVLKLSDEESPRAVSQTERDAEAKADAQAQARELARPVAP